MLTCCIVRNAFTFICQEKIFGLVKAVSQEVQNSDRKQVVRKGGKCERKIPCLSHHLLSVAILSPSRHGLNQV